MNAKKCLWTKQNFCLVTALVLALLLPLGKAAIAAENEGVEHFKMLSSVEYSGQKQFKHQVRTLFTVKKQLLSDDSVRYFISSSDFDLAGDDTSPGQQSSSRELSFVVDKENKNLSGGGKELALLEKINNHCIRSLKTVTKQNIGKTWNQSFNLSPVGDLLRGELKLTLTAIELKTKAAGEIIAVRALSEPFVITAARTSGGTGDVKARLGAVYLFDPEMENIYLSISVFEAETDMNGSKEKLRHEIATYKTNAEGVSVDLSGLGRKFEEFVKKVGLNKQSLKVVKESALPQWARTDGLIASQAANICAATACEGAPNPVATIYVPVARTVAMQSFGTLASAGTFGAVSSTLATSVTGVAGMKIAAAPAIMGMGAGTTGAIAGGGAAAVAVGASGGGGGGGDDRSPSTP